MSNAGEGDKRKVSTDALETLGTIIGPNEKRDAIHLAVEPVTAVVRVFPGQHVNAKGEPTEPYVGIVDPFVSDPVQVGQRFWLVIYPRQIHSLRHVWTHPAFPDEPEVAGMAPQVHVDAKAASEAWLKNFCEQADCPGFHAVMGWIENPTGWSPDEYMHFDGLDAHGDIPDEFWHHAEIFLGRKLHTRPAAFSCSC